MRGKPEVRDEVRDVQETNNSSPLVVPALGGGHSNPLLLLPGAACLWPSTEPTCGTEPLPALPGTGLHCFGQTHPPLQLPLVLLLYLQLVLKLLLEPLLGEVHLPYSSLVLQAPFATCGVGGQTARPRLPRVPEKGQRGRRMGQGGAAGGVSQGDSETSLE